MKANNETVQKEDIPETFAMFFKEKVDSSPKILFISTANRLHSDF